MAGVAGSHLVAGVLLLRALSLAGVVLLAVFVPRLARALGADPARAVWLAVISPLVLLELIAAGHNDALMAGLLVAGVYFAVERRPVLGIALCSAAVAIKLPAAVGVALVAACWFWATPSRRGRIRVVALSAVTAAAVLAIVSLAAGVGAHWVSGKLLSTPGRVHLAITPSTAAGYSIASLLRSLGIASVGFHSLESAFSSVAVALTAGLGAVLCWRVRYERLALYLGILLIAAVLGGPAAWPWYLTWGVCAARRRPPGAALARPARRARPRLLCDRARRPCRRGPAQRAVDVRRLRGGRDRRGRLLPPAPAGPLDPRRRVSVSERIVDPAAPAPATGAGTAVAGAAWWRTDRALSGAALLGPCLLALILTSIDLSTRSFWLDEGATVAIASQHGSALWNAIAHDGGNMLVYYLLQHVVIGLFGDAAAVIRLPS